MEQIQRWKCSWPEAPKNPGTRFFPNVSRGLTVDGPLANLHHHCLPCLSFISSSGFWTPLAHMPWNNIQPPGDMHSIYSTTFKHRNPREYVTKLRLPDLRWVCYSKVPHPLGRFMPRSSTLSHIMYVFQGQCISQNYRNRMRSDPGGKGTLLGLGPCIAPGCVIHTPKKYIVRTLLWILLHSYIQG